MRRAEGLRQRLEAVVPLLERGHGVEHRRRAGGIGVAVRGRDQEVRCADRDEGRGNWVEPGLADDGARQEAGEEAEQPPVVLGEGVEGLAGRRRGARVGLFEGRSGHGRRRLVADQRQLQRGAAQEVEEPVVEGCRCRGRSAGRGS
jgi:hypothetical protein